MKVIVLLFVFYFHATSYLFARIINGYEHRLLMTQVALRSLKLRLAAGGASTAERLKMETEMDQLITYISCYDLTDEMISRMRIVSPEIFMNIDTIKDKRGRATDVYVRIIPKDKSRIPLKAATFISQAVGDIDASFSEYGLYTVSVDVCIGDQAVFLLSHEFGHIKYIVPNLAEYTAFYKRCYGRSRYLDASFIGHGYRDESGKWATRFEKKYIADKLMYQKSGGKKKPQDFAVLYSRLKRKYRDLQNWNANSIADAD